MKLTRLYLQNLGEALNFDIDDFLVMGMSFQQVYSELKLAISKKYGIILNNKGDNV